MDKLERFKYCGLVDDTASPGKLGASLGPFVLVLRAVSPCREVSLGRGYKTFFFVIYRTAK